jgi:hypothetical protein
MTLLCQNDVINDQNANLVRELVFIAIDVSVAPIFLSNQINYFSL